MLHHELIAADERNGLERLLALLASHPNAHCTRMGSLLTSSAEASGP